jgi:hypothetical protein
MPLTAKQETLAGLAGAVVVIAAPTDVWKVARRGFARLLGRGDPERTRAARRRLEETHHRLTEATGENLERARELAAKWVTRLEDLLEDDPGVETDLDALVWKILKQLPLEDLTGQVSRNVISGERFAQWHEDFAEENDHPRGPAPVKGLSGDERGD